MSGSRGMAMCFQKRRRPLRFKRMRIREHLALVICGLAGAWIADSARAQTPAGPDKVTLDQAIQLAIAHNHSLLAARTTIVQNQALEVQANVRPNPTLFTDWEYLPLVPISGGLAAYLRNSTEG